MFLQIMSDLHCEFGYFDIQNAEADVLVLAGDIGIASKSYTFEPFIEEACSSFEHVIMVMGNHEHYHGDINKSFSLIKEACPFDNFHLLETSLAVNNGTGAGAPSEDYDGNPRPQGEEYDIGAYER